MESRGHRSGRTGRPPRLSQEAILVAAQHILDTEGPERLSMRRLAREMSSTAMALYHHVQDKDELLLLLLDAHARRYPRPVLPSEPRTRLLAAAQVLHDLLADCPWIVEVLSFDDFVSESSLWVVESIVDAAVGCGMTLEDAVYAYRVIWHYTTGELAIRVSRERARARPERPEYREHALEFLDSVDFPRLNAVGRQWARLTSRDDHRRGLEAVVAGLLEQEAEVVDVMTDAVRACPCC
ncbi:TetR/AcrR family transcriptional regulator [Streptomyces sp. YIM 132580]|uniref:TetR/AcrR family transcriptional regulator n=1 Tax=Streptomyces sp. YIM 132580 TaxID=2691958 RepID=UPI00136DB304|nr:TetR/AcrR family transcriptional regulator [Streptomyces sp. YIM 132580]MXG28944.1 TetR family transcriptional regulator [Streptomyces sp. YIM 132580]